VTMKVVITGISGFVGSNLSVYLRESGHELVGVDINDPVCPAASRIFAWDELDKLPQSDVFIHLAGKAHDNANCSDPEDYFKVNVGLTKKIFNAFLKNKAEKFVFFSSVKAVADTVGGHCLTEDCIPDPQTPYGLSKLKAEKYLLDRKLPENIKLYILRPCMIHGPGNRGNLNLLYQMVKKGIPYPLGVFENLRSFTSIKNVQFVVESMIKKDIPPGIYNLADDEALSTTELVRCMSKHLGKKERVWNISQSLIRSAARAGDVIRLPLNSERLKKLTECYVVSNAKIKKKLRIGTMPCSAREGLKYTLESFSNE